MGRLGGPPPFGEGGKLVTGLGPRQVDSESDAAFNRAVEDLKGSQTNRAAAVTTPVFLIWGHFPAIFRMFREAGASDCLAMSNAAREDASKQLPVLDEHKMLAVVTLKGPQSGKKGGFVPQTKLFGTTLFHWRWRYSVTTLFHWRWRQSQAYG